MMSNLNEEKTTEIFSANMVEDFVDEFYLALNYLDSNSLKH
jgi:hypothetical protein